MIRGRCRHFQSGPRQLKFLQTRTFIRQGLRNFTKRTPIVFTKCLAPRSQKGFTKSIHTLFDEIDEAIQNPPTLLELREQKKLGRTRVPLAVSSEIEKHLRLSPILSVSELLDLKQYNEAWEEFDKLAYKDDKEALPYEIAKRLLSFLHFSTDMYSSSSNRKGAAEVEDPSVLHRRLETLLNHMRTTRAFWKSNDISDIITLFGKLGLVERFETIFRNLPRYCESPATIDTYNSMLSAYLRMFKTVNRSECQRLMTKMESLLHTMQQHNTQPDITSYNLIIAAKVKTGKLKDVEKIYQKMNADPNRMTFNILLNGFLRVCHSSKDINTIETWMDRMSKAGIAPNGKTFNNIMNGLTDKVEYYRQIKAYDDMGRAARAVTYLYKSMTKFRFKIDIVGLNTLIKCYSITDDRKELDNIIGMLRIPAETHNPDKPDNQHTPKYSPDDITFNSLISYYLKRGDFHEARRMHDLMATMKLGPDAFTYAHFLDYFVKQGNMTDALVYYDAMQKKGIPNNTNIYNILLNGYLKGPKQSEEVAKRLKDIVIQSDNMRDSIARDTDTYNTRMTFLGIAEDMNTAQGQVQAIFDEMVLKGATPDTRTYNIALKIYGDTATKATAEELNAATNMLIDSMEHAGLKKDIFTYTTLVRNAVRQGDLRSAERTLNSMIEANVQPNAFVFSHLVNGHVQAGNLDKAHNIVRHMHKPPFNVQPECYVYTALIYGYAKAEEYALASNTFCEMLARGVKADVVTYSTLVKAILESPTRIQSTQVIELMKDFNEIGNQQKGLDQPTLTLLIEAHGVAADQYLGSGEDTMDKRQAMADRHAAMAQDIYNSINQPDPLATTALLTTFRKTRKIEEAWQFWQRLENNPAIQLNITNYNALLTCLALDKGWYATAKSVFEKMIGKALFEDSRSREGSMQFGKHTRCATQPNSISFDTMILCAANNSDDESIRRIWRLSCRPRRDYNTENYTHYTHENQFDILITTYYYAMQSLAAANSLEEAREAYFEFRSLPQFPDSATVWMDRIQRLAARHGFNNTT